MKNSNNNLPQKQSNNIFNRIYCFLKKLFYRETTSMDENIPETIQTAVVEKSDFSAGIKVDKNAKKIENKKNAYIDDIIKGSKLLNSLSTDKLEKILNYLKDENNKKSELLKQLSR